jgi:hypothetical protein
MYNNIYKKPSIILTLPSPKERVQSPSPSEKDLG